MKTCFDEITDIPPTHPDRYTGLETDDRGRDVLARLLYGFNIGISFSLIVTILSYTIGVSIGSFSVSSGQNRYFRTEIN